MIWVRRSRSPASSRTTTLLPFSGVLLIGALTLLSLFVLESQGVRELLLGIRVLHHVLEQRLELVVAVGLGEEVPQLLTGVDQLAQRLDLLHDVVRLGRGEA